MRYRSLEILIFIGLLNCISTEGVFGSGLKGIEVD